MKYTIALEMKETIEKKLTKIMAKAEKYGCPFKFEISAEYVKEVPVWVRDGGEERKIGSAHVEVCDLIIDADEIVKNGENEVLAKIEHFENGNIITTFGCKEQPEWAVIKPHCDHCMKNRVKTVTFMVRKKNGEVKQVGRTCLRDFTGIDPQSVGYLNDIENLVYDADADRYFDSDRITGSRLFDIQTALAHAVDVIKAQGYVKSDREGSNKAKVYDLLKKHEVPSADALNKAEEMVKVFGSLTKEEAWDNDLTNPRTMAVNGWCKPSLIGYVAYMPISFYKFIERKKKEEEREARRQEEASASEYVGEVGQKITVDLKEAILVTSWETVYGMTHLYKFVDVNGNIYVWFASRCIDIDNCTKIKGTIKDHNERDGVKQTVITRCKVA